MKINVVKNVLQSNDIVAQENRKVFLETKTLAVNFISSPGSGKTTLLEKTIASLNPSAKSAVLVGDLQTTRDADRLAPYADQVTQINTGMSCHLYANQISQSLADFDLAEMDYIFIENVGNMVCPGEFDLGENIKVTLLSLPEGDDKVAKYPTIFRAADIVLLTKVDLMDVLNFDLQKVKDDLNKLNKNVQLLEYSALTGQGQEEWLQWLKEKRLDGLGMAAKAITS